MESQYIPHEVVLTNTLKHKILAHDSTAQFGIASLAPNQNNGINKYTQATFIIVADGYGYVILGDEKMDIKEGDALVVAPNTSHDIYAGALGLKLYIIHAPMKDTVINTLDYDIAGIKPEFDVTELNELYLGQHGGPLDIISDYVSHYIWDNVFDGLELQSQHIEIKLPYNLIETPVIIDSKLYFGYDNYFDHSKREERCKIIRLNLKTFQLEEIITYNRLQGQFGLVIIKTIVKYDNDLYIFTTESDWSNEYVLIPLNKNIDSYDIVFDDGFDHNKQVNIYGFNNYYTVVANDDEQIYIADSKNAVYDDISIDSDEYIPNFGHWPVQSDVYIDEKGQENIVIIAPKPASTIVYWHDTADVITYPIAVSRVNSILNRNIHFQVDGGVIRMVRFQPDQTFQETQFKYTNDKIGNARIVISNTMAAVITVQRGAYQIYLIY